MKLGFYKVREGATIPRYQTTGSGAFDFHLVEDAVVQPKEVRLMPTGLVAHIPSGHVLIIASRSSTPLKRGVNLPNGIGVIDSDYCGPTDEIHIQVRNFGVEAVELKAGERIAQGMVIEAPQWEIEELLEPPQQEARGGFGSTGI